MTQYAITVQEGHGHDAQAVYFTNEQPLYEAESAPIFAVMDDERIQVGEREEVFVVFKPLNGPSRRRGKSNRIPFNRVLSVVAAEISNAEA